MYLGVLLEASSERSGSWATATMTSFVQRKRGVRPAFANLEPDVTIDTSARRSALEVWSFGAKSYHNTRIPRVAAQRT